MPAEPKLHHVGIIVRNEAQAATLLSILGLRESHRQFVPEYEAECIFTEGAESRLELIVPRGGKLAQFNQGIGGLHHIAMEVDDLAAASARLKSLGIQLLEPSPVRAGDLLINFLPPVYTRGVIVEFVQRIGTEI
jgi:methylmalonyl-CoA epimerase